RVRQIVIWTVKQMGVNESIEKGIEMNPDVLLEEESKKRKSAQDSKRIVKNPKKEPKKKGWSRYYSACRECGTTTIPHLRHGLCEQCEGGFRGERRESIITAHGNKCDKCGRNRYEAAALYGRDFYITKKREVFCKGCFSEMTGRKLGSYKHHEWSRLYERCLKCGKTDAPHFKKGICESCSDEVANREKMIVEHGEKCDQCSISRNEARQKYKRDLFATKAGAVYCRVCFQQYAKSGMSAAKQRKRERAS
ncbi:MAG: hypothetical protein Athens041674_208, partial [Parcubacteria group bacterium Athens0416_74]